LTPLTDTLPELLAEPDPMLMPDMLELLEPLELAAVAAVAVVDDEGTVRFLSALAQPASTIAEVAIAAVR
jgi:hypothetical protein